MDLENAITVRGLTKHNGPFEAVRGIDFQVRTGEVFALLGPNGAGKTTTVEILEGLRPRSGGDVTVLGFDPGVQVNRLKDRIGVCLQATNLPDKMKVIEAMEVFSSFYSRRLDARDVLGKLQLWDRRGSFYSTLSGGQKQRLALALALLNDPQLLFFDEPTAGLDPQVRLGIHGLIEQLRRERRTILLTTHYIEEAERLCDRVAIIDEGRIITIGTPEEIKASTAGHSRIEIVCGQPLADRRLPGSLGGVKAHVSADGLTVIAACGSPAPVLVKLVRWIDKQGIELVDIHLKRPTLEDVFLELTGKSLRE